MKISKQNLRIYGSYIYDGLQEPATSIPGKPPDSRSESDMAKPVCGCECHVYIQSDSDVDIRSLLQPPHQSLYVTSRIYRLDRPGIKHS